MRKFLASLGILSLVLALAAPALAATSANVTATVSVKEIAVSVDPTSFDYGVLDAGATSTSTGSPDPAGIDATNDGNVKEDFSIRGADTTNWVLAGTAGVNTYVHEASIDSFVTPVTLNNTSSEILSGDPEVADDGVAVANSVNFKLRLTAPTENTGALQQSAQVTVLATEDD